MGNLICVKKGNNAKHKLMISAHMDEVGFMVTGYGEGGVLKFATVGGIDSRILLGKRLIVGDKKLAGSNRWKANSSSKCNRKTE